MTSMQARMGFMELDDLRAQLSAPTDDEQSRPTIMVAPDAPAQPVLNWLEHRFATDDDLTVLTVRIGDAAPGIISRDGLLDLITPISKGTLGDGDGFQLPGIPQLSGLQFRCGVDGATYTFYFYDVSAPPTCQLHPGTVLDFQ
jgi:hypothetical protein